MGKNKKKKKKKLQKYAKEKNTEVKMEKVGLKFKNNVQIYGSSMYSISGFEGGLYISLNGKMPPQPQVKTNIQDEDIKTLLKRTNEYIVINIEDGDFLDDYDFWKKLIEKTLEKYDRININCMGGHGRTGTLIALYYLFSYTPKELLEKHPDFNTETLIKLIKEKYDTKAIETVKQFKLLRKYIYRYFKENNTEIRCIKAENLLKYDKYSNKSYSYKGYYSGYSKSLLDEEPFKEEDFDDWEMREIEKTYVEDISDA